MARESRPPLATDGKKTTAEASHEASRTRRKRRRGAAIAGGLACALGIGIAIAAAQAPASRATSLGADAFVEDDSFPQGGAAEYSKEALYRSGGQTSQGGYENALAQPTYDAWTVEEPTESGGKDVAVVKENQPIYVRPESVDGSSGSHGTDGSGVGGFGDSGSHASITDPSSAVLPNEEGIHVYESVDEWLHAQTRATETEALSKQAAYMRHESMCAAARRSTELSNAEASAEIAGTSSMTFTVELGHGIREETLNALFALLNEGDTWLDGLRGCWQLDMYIGAVSPTQRPIAVLKFTPPAAGSEAFGELVQQVRSYDLAGYCKACLGMSRLVRQVIEDDEIVTVAADDASQGNVSIEGTTAFAKDRFDENRWEYGALGFEDTWSTVTVDRKNTIAVIDTGFAPTHIDLSKMYVGAYNATTGQKGLASLYPVDYHGTHVAGILAAEAGNGSGISGLSHNANIMPVQVGTRDASGNTQIDINHVWEAFKYVLDNADEYNVKVINVSLSSTSSNSAQRAVLQARYSEYVEAAKSKGILVVAAAGNLGGGTSSYKSYPAALPDALGVMSLARQSGESADDIMYSCDPDSNYNEATDAGAFDYEVGAPGVNILSCYPYVRGYDSRQGDPQNDRDKWSDTAFAVKSGTSMATPQVAALASLVYAIDPGLTPAEVKDAVCQNADKGRVDEPLAAKQGCGAIRPAATVRYVHNRTYALFTLRLGSGNAAATGNASYASNMAGAEYSVTDAVSNKEIGTLVFDGSSMEATIELARGRKYWVRQTKAPAGFRLATDPFDVTIPRLTSSNGSTPRETEFSDNLISDNPSDEIAGLGDPSAIPLAPISGHRSDAVESGKLATPDETIGSDEQPSGNTPAVGSGEPLVRDIALTPQQCVIEVRCVDVSDGEAQGISCVGGDEKRFTVALCAADENGELRQNSDGSPVVILEQKTDESGHVAFGPVADGHYIVRQVYAPFPYGLASEDDRDIAVTVSEATASSVRVDIHNKIRQGGVTVRVVNDLNESLPGASYALVALQDVKDANGEIIYAQNDVVALQQDGTGRYTAQPGRAGEDNPVLVTGDDGIIDIQGLMLGNNAETAFEMRSYGPVAGHVEASDSIVFRFDANGVPDKENGTQAAPRIVCQTRNGIVTRLVAANDNERGIPGATMAMWPQSKSVVYKAGSEESSGEVRTEFATPIDEGQATGVQVEGSVEDPVGGVAAASNQCKITFKANLGKNAKSIERSVSVAKNQPVALEANSFKRTGYTFAGWGKQATRAPLAYVDQQTLTPTEDMVLYARWTAFPKTITFNKNGGQGTMSAITARQGDEVTLPPNKLTRDGYTFVGWNTKSTGKGTKYQDEGTVTLGNQGKTLYAQWATNARTITFDRNAGKGSMDAVPTQKGDRIKLPANQFTRKGYTFAGWNTSKDGTGQKYANQAGITVENDLTLYAQWEEVKPVDAVIIRTPGESTTKQPSAVKVDAANTLTTSSAEIAGRWHGDIQAWVIDGLAPNSRYHIKFGNHRVKTIQTSDAGNQSHYARYAPLTYQEAPEHQMYIKGCWVDQAALPQTDDLALLTTTSGEAGREGIAEFRKIVPGDANTDSVKYTVVELLPPNDIGKSEARICSTEEHRVSINRTNFTVSVNDRDWMAVESSGVFHDGETTLEIYRMSSQGGVDAAAIGREMKLTDAYGRTVDQWTIQDDSPRVFVGLAPGVYYITDIVSEDTHVIADTIEVTLMPATNLQRTTMFDAPFVIGVDVDLQQEIAKPLDNADMEDGDGENRASVGNRPAGEYSYSLDFASRSNGWVDEMIITQELPSKDGLAELVSVTTPQTWQDADGKMSVWYRTDKGGDALPDDAASNAALDAANAQPTAYAGWKLWRADVPAMEATLLSMSDLRESGALAEDENVTAIRLAYGRVEKWFATHKPPADSADADAAFNKDLHDDVDEVVREHPETVQQVDPEALAVREKEVQEAADEVVGALGQAFPDSGMVALSEQAGSQGRKQIAHDTTQPAGSTGSDADWQETKAAQLDAYGTLAQDSSSVQYAVLTKKSMNALRISSNTMAGLHTQSPSTQASQPEGTQSYQPVIKTMSAGSQVGESAKGALSAQSHDEDTVVVPVTPELIAMLQSAILEADFDAHYAPAVITMRATEEYRAGKTLVSRAQALLHVHRPDGKGVTVEGTDSGYTPVIYDVNGGTVRVEGTGDGGIIMTRPAGSDSGSDFLYFDDDDQQGSANNSTFTPQPQTTPASSDAIPATSNYDTVQQSAKHRDVGIGTRLTASSGAKTVGLSNKSVTLTDEVHYEGLSTNRMYTVTGELHVRAGAGAEGDVFDGGIASANGKSLVAAVEFVPAESSGTVPVLFEVPASSVGACPLVAFETICEGRVLEGGGEVARHADINDAEQTVEIVSDSVPQAGGQSDAAGQPAANFPWGTGSTGASGGSANGGTPGSGSTFFGNGSRGTSNAGAPGPTSSIAQTGDAVVVAAVTLAAAGGIAFAAIRKMREGNNA